MQSSHTENTYGNELLIAGRVTSCKTECEINSFITLGFIISPHGRTFNNYFDYNQGTVTN